MSPRLGTPQPGTAGFHRRENNPKNQLFSGAFGVLVYVCAYAYAHRNRHVNLKHCPQSVPQSLPQQDEQPAASIAQQPAARPARQQAQKKPAVKAANGQKQQGSIVPTSVRAKPSKTNGSQELQAGSRANQEPAISTSADVQKSGKRSSKVSIENANIDK